MIAVENGILCSYNISRKWYTIAIISVENGTENCPT